MQRTILLLALLLPVPLLAQRLSDSTNRSTNDKQNDLLGKGAIGVSLDGAGGFGEYSGATYRFIPRVSYFLLNGWSVALEGRHEYRTNSYRYTGVGLSSRYYFVRDRRLALFLQAGVTAGQVRSGNYQLGLNGQLIEIGPYKSPAIQANAGLGVLYRLNSRWALQFTAEGTATSRRFLQYSRLQTQANIGVAFRIK